MAKFWKDLRYARRALGRSPGFAAAVVLTLALGIGANVAVFTVVESVLLAPLPYGAPQGLVMVWSRWKDFPDKTWISPAEYHLYRHEVASFADLAAFNQTTGNLTGGDQPERVDAALVTPNFFRVLGVPVARGRDFGPRDGLPGGEAVAILSDRLWRRRFAADPALVGRTVELDGETTRVVGILPPGIQLPTDYRANRETVVWAPFQIPPVEGVFPKGGGNHGLYGVARLRQGVSPGQAAAEVRALLGRLTRAGLYDEASHFEAPIVPVAEEVSGPVRPAVLALLAAVAFLLLIACANVANLLLARREAREKEVALRAALGASRADLLRHLLAESALLAVAGGAVGVWLVDLALAPLLRLAPAGVPRLGEVSLDGRVLAFALVVTGLTALFFGLAPAFQASRPDLVATLKEGGRGAFSGRRSQRLRRVLVVAQVAMAVVLVAGAGIMLRSVRRLLAVDPGFKSAGALTVELATPVADYQEPADVARFYRELLARVRALPGVAAAGAVRTLPLTREIGDWGFQIEGYMPPPDDRPKGDWQVATPGYFEAMGIPVLAGRSFDAGDGAGAPLVVVVGETLARAYWPRGEALGKRIRVGQDGAPWMTVVGVVGDVRYGGLAAAPRKLWYRPQEQFPETAGGSPARAMTLVVRTAGDPKKLVPEVREAVRSLDPRIPLAEVRTLDEVLGSAVGKPRFTSLLLALFGALALGLAGVGIYGVTAYTVARRTHEIGVRLALGAAPRKVLGAVVGQAMALAAAGLALGLAAAVVLARLLASLVYGAGAGDPTTLALAGLVLAATALVASWLPARRAARLDPVEALRAE